MGYIKMQCPNCHAGLEIDTEKLLAHCPYCGAKITFDAEQMADILREKEYTKREEIRTSAEVKRAELYTLRDREENLKNYVPLLIIIVIGITLFSICCLIMSPILKLFGIFF